MKLNKIKLSGTTYEIQDLSAQPLLSAGTGIQISGNVISAIGGGSGTSTVELTQAEYDALVSGGTVNPDVFYIITDATPIDASSFWTSAQTQSAITEAISGKADTSAVTAVNNVLTAHTGDTTIHVTSSDKTAWSGKQDALVSGTNIKTINNESILGSGNITIQGGGMSSGEVQTMIDTSVSGKQDTLVSGTNIKTINNESILGSGNIIIEGGGSITISSAITSGDTNAVAGGAVYDKIDEVEQVTARALNGLAESLATKVDASAITSSVTSASTDSQIPTAKAVFDAIPTGSTSGKAISAGTNISVTTGETADTVSCTLPIEVVGIKGIQLSGLNNSCAGGQGNVVFGYECKTLREINGNQAVFGVYNQTYQNCEFACGKNNVCRHGSSSDDKTLFTVGNGAAWYNRHNAFEIRENGDIYISSGGTDIKLQDHLGSTPSSAITSGDTNAVAGGAVYDKIDEVEQVTAAALNNLNYKFGGLKLVQISQSDYDGLTVKDNSTLYIIV